MSYSLIWLPEVLEAAGLKVALVDGWTTRGRAEMGTVRGVICHHTATAIVGNMPTLKTLVNGRSDLQGPLAQLGLGKDGTYYVIAAGRCNHAGVGIFRGISTGNSSFIGIEAEHSGLPSEEWSEIQYYSYVCGVAAILKKINASVDFCIGHKEFATPTGRKSDPNFDMIKFRADVQAHLDGSAVKRPLIPSVEANVNSNNMPRPTLRRGVVSDLVRNLQVRLNCISDGYFGAKTEAALREFQRKNGLVADGIIGPKTWKTLDAT
jgi:peptidoglycan hydrolase-like protein with peptidoglycan-binding domain